MHRHGGLLAGVVAVLCATGCGRIGFDPATGDGATGAWWNSAWSYRKPLVVDHTRVAGDLVDFPVLVVVTDPALGTHARADGDDLAFVDAAGTQLAHEIERISAQPTTLVAWVKLPAVSSTTDTTFYLYYGNPAAQVPPDPTRVWSNAFTGVYHFGNGVTLDPTDATGLNHGTNNGVIATTTAIIHGAAELTGAPTIRAPTAGVDPSPGGLNTVTFWMMNTGAVNDAPFAFENAGSTVDLWFLRDDCFGFNTEQGEVLGTSIGGLLGRWVHVAAVFFNGVPTASQNQLYIDGVRQTLTACEGGTASSRSAGGTISWGSNSGYELDGLLDEGRIARGARPATWIATEFANQREPAVFLRAGPEETVPP